MNGKLGDCGVDSMLAPCPQLQASSPLPFTFCPGNEAGCLDTFGRQLLHMGCGQRVYVCVLQDSGPSQTSCSVCVWECVFSWISSIVLNLDWDPVYWQQKQVRICMFSLGLLWEKCPTKSSGSPDWRWSVFIKQGPSPDSSVCISFASLNTMAHHSSATD